MIVALHSAPKGFFKGNPLYSNNELIEFVQKAASLGFKAVQIGPLRDYLPIDSECLKMVLHSLQIEKNVHVGEIYDAGRFASMEQEYTSAKKRIRYAIMLCKEISSPLMSIHPPFFRTRNDANNELLLKARTRFFELVREETDFASSNHVKIALESFCYHPFIFSGVRDLAQFVSRFSSEKLGVLLDVGHLYQAGIDLSEAIQLFKHRLADIHVHDATLKKDYRRATHLPIGKGTINFSELVNRLREAGYDRWLTLEIRGSEKEISESKERLERLLKGTT